MKIQSLHVENYPPIKSLTIKELGDVVILAGANGSGKTRLKDAIVQTVQGGSVINMRFRATREDEVEAFGGDSIEILEGQPNTRFDEYIRSRKFGRGQFVGSLVQIDSQRNIQTIKYQPVNWLGADPDDQEISGNYFFSGFTNRWQQFMNYIHQKSAVRDKKLADELKKNPTDGEEILNKSPDPLERYKKIFDSLLPDKELQDIDPAHPKEFTYKDAEGNVLPFNTLSSGEQEVIKILFDVAKKDIRHSVIIVDEPELHLHPTLTFKLVETLKTVGDHTNQFIFLTHSADLISTYYSTGNVYFIDTDQTGANQAHKLSDLKDSHPELVNLIGENLGLFAVGKKLVFIEGKDSSIDRLTYHAIAQGILSDVKIIPVGQVDNLNSLSVLEQQIRNSIFGIDLYMIRDRDGLSEEQVLKLEAEGRIKCLKRRHIENYFLDAEVLFKVAEKLYLNTTKPEISVEHINNKTKEIAESTLGLNFLQNTKDWLLLNRSMEIPTVKNLQDKDLDTIKNEILVGVGESLGNLSNVLSNDQVEKWMDEEKTRLEQALNNNHWVEIFQGKIIFAKVCFEILGGDALKIRQAYIDIALQEKPEVLEDIQEIFKSFKK